MLMLAARHRLEGRSVFVPSIPYAIGRLIKRVVPCLLLGLLAGCGGGEAPLSGERIPIIAEITPPRTNTQAAGEGVGLGAVFTNQRFDQPGRTAGHRGGHIAFDWPPSLQWSAAVGVAADFATQMGQAVADSRRVYAITPDAVVTALDLETGDRVWARAVEERFDETQTSISGGLALDLGTLYAHANGRTLRAYDAATGTELWQQAFPIPLVGGPTASAGRVLVTDIDGKLYAMSARDGSSLWTRVGNPDATSVIGSASPALAQDQVIYTGNDGEVVALSADQGEFLWGDNLAALAPRTALDGINSVIAHPVHDGGLVFVVTISGRFVSFNAGTGRGIWELPLASNQMPWLAGQSIYIITTRGRVYALRRRDGALRWVQELPGAIPFDETISDDPVHYLGPIVANNQLLLASQSGRIYALNARTGEIEGTVSVANSLSVAPIVNNGRLIVFDDSGRVSVYQ